MLFRLILLLTTVPLVELVLLLWVAKRISWGPTILLVIGTGALGAVLARHQGIRTIARIRAEVASGKTPTGSMLDGMMILIAGIVLMTPGILTDALGFLLLVPPFRKWVGRVIGRSIQFQVGPMHPRVDSTFVDVEATGRYAEDFEDDRSNRTDALP